MSERNVVRILVAAVLASALAVPALPSFGCAVCFGDSDSPMARAADLSILFMVLVTYALIVGGIATVIALRLKARRKALAAAAGS